MYVLKIEADDYSTITDWLGANDIASVSHIEGTREYKIFSDELIYVQMAADSLGCDYDEIEEC